MQKANQEQLIQNANIALINIRTLEVSYLSIFFGNFGTQFALITGLVAQAVTQVPALGAECGIVISYIYWISSALTFSFSMHGLLCSVFVDAYGQV